jgi:hypothetical protein
MVYLVPTLTRQTLFYQDDDVIIGRRVLGHARVIRRLAPHNAPPHPQIAQIKPFRHVEQCKGQCRVRLSTLDDESYARLEECRGAAPSPAPLAVRSWASNPPRPTVSFAHRIKGCTCSELSAFRSCGCFRLRTSGRGVRESDRALSPRPSVGERRRTILRGAEWHSTI